MTLKGHYALCFKTNVGLKPTQTKANRAKAHRTKALSRQRFFATSAVNGRGSEMATRHISGSRAHSDKIPTATPVFVVKLSSDGTSDFVGRRCVLDSGNIRFIRIFAGVPWRIQDGSQITGSSNNFASFTDTYVVPKIIQWFMTICTKQINLQQSWATLLCVENPR